MLLVQALSPHVPKQETKLLNLTMDLKIFKFTQINKIYLYCVINTLIMCLTHNYFIKGYTILLPCKHTVSKADEQQPHGSRSGTCVVRKLGL